MRKVIILAITVLMNIALKGQIILEKTYSITSSEPITYSLYQVNKNIYYSEAVGYVLFDSRDNSLKIYNLDYSLQSSKTILIPPGYEMYYFMQPSKYLYNNNDKVEFTAIFIKTGEYKYITQIQDEDGNSLVQLNGYVNLTDYIANNKFMMKATYMESINANDVYKEEIYSLGGIVPTGNSFIELPSVENPYPNPSNTIINIPYELQGSNVAVLSIYNSNGQIVETKKIDSYFKEIRLNVSNYQPGVYMYEYNRITNLFIVK
ncbi:MAG: T9SS type A sorting domain-containing protein [Bacteroidota bacterium]